MITSKNEYHYYLEADRISLGIQGKRPNLLGNEIWKFERLLRKLEYLKNCKKGFFWKFYFLINYYIYRNLGIKLGFEIPLNCFGAGLAIAHRGVITINGNAKIGCNCRIVNSVTIGATNGSDKAPQLGNNIFIGASATIFGDIEIADDVAIGANSVVNKSFKESGITVAGVPAKKTNSKGSELNIIRATEILSLRGTI